MKPNETKNSNIVNQFAPMLTNPKFLLKLASRERPDNFFRSLDNIRDFIQTDNFIVVASLDIDDHTMISKQVKERIETYKNVKAYWGTSTSKVDAVNRDVCFGGDFSILINVSDDQLFTVKGFDSIITEFVNANFTDTDFFAHFHDGKQNRLATMSIIGKMWYDRTKTIYHPSYRSEYCDNHEQEKAKILGKYKYAGDNVRIMEHINPYVGHKEVMDDLYRRNSQYVQQDRATFFEWQSKNFGL